MAMREATTTTSLDSWLQNILVQAYQTTVRTSSEAIATELQDVFGQRIVAHMAGVADPKSIGRWARGAREPRSETEQRLRDVFQIYKFLALAESREAGKAWFIGMNPHLGSRAPFAILAEDPKRSPEVLEAAKAFVVNG